MTLDDPIISIKGVGTKLSETLQKYGFYTVKDLIYNLPRTYENYQSAQQISDITPGKVVIKGRIDSITTRNTSRRNFRITEGIIRDHSDAIRVVWFNQPYRATAFNPKKDYLFSGDYVFQRGRYQLVNPTAELASDSHLQHRDILPVYVAHGQTLNSRFFARLMDNLRTEFSIVPDLIPNMAAGARRKALYNLHFPSSQAAIEDARETLAYEELFELILAAELNKTDNHKLRAPTCPFIATNTQKLIQSLPFQLTDAQRLATWQILQDLEKPTPMNRLLQGDVGSGKTVVSAIAAHQVIMSGYQVALLAPTAILAAQHAETISALLTQLGINVALLTGSTKHKDLLKKQIATGNVDLIIGTHALLTDDTRFHSLGLVIIDEQHRFGVEQRRKLLVKNCAGGAAGEGLKKSSFTRFFEEEAATGPAPHLLSMTATPIPRSLQLAIFGDLDVSTIATLPKGRQPIVTKILNEVNLQDDLYPVIREKLQQKDQVYWICKAIDDNPKEETVSVKKQTEKLRKIFTAAKIEFLHGRMKPAEKDAVMAAFAQGKIDILISTTVVEVGVNVPNATQIIIMDAEKYGLAQLHQLRGRVGRGSKPSNCYLIAPEDRTPSRRLRELEHSTDGFHLAEVDLELRGPGEIYGALQHGALNLRIASLSDGRLIAKASQAAKAFARQITQNPEIMLQYKELSTNLKKYQQLTTLN